MIKPISIFVSNLSAPNFWATDDHKSKKLQSPDRLNRPQDQMQTQMLIQSNEVSAA